MISGDGAIYLFILVLIIGTGTAFVVMYVDAYIEDWKNMTPETTSCEIIAHAITGNSKKPWYDDVLEHYNKVWVESNCDDETSENWKGDDWRYKIPKPTTQDRINDVNVKLER